MRRAPFKPWIVSIPSCRSRQVDPTSAIFSWASGPSQKINPAWKGGTTAAWHLHANRQEPPRLECIREYHGPSCPARASGQAWEVPSGSPLHGRARPGQSPMPRSRQPDLFLYAFVSSRVGVEVRARWCDWQYESSSFIQPDLQGSESLSRARVTRSNSPAKYFCTASLKI